MQDSVLEIGAVPNKETLFGINCTDIRLAENTKISIGENFRIESGKILTTYENSKIKVGNDCLFSSNVILFSGDGSLHKIYRKEDMKMLNAPGNIEIEDRVWCGLNTMIMKKAKISSDSIVGAGSVVTKRFEESNIIIAGNPAKKVKEGIVWTKN